MRRETNFVTRFLRAGAALGAAALVAACSSSPPPSPAVSSDQQQTAQSAPAQPTVDPNAPVLVALLAPTSASGKRTRAAAQDLTAAAQMARRDHAPANLSMKIYDTQGTPEGAAAAASQASGVRSSAWVRTTSEFLVSRFGNMRTSLACASSSFSVIVLHQTRTSASCVKARTASLSCPG